MSKLLPLLIAFGTSSIAIVPSSSNHLDAAKLANINASANVAYVCDLEECTQTTEHSHSLCNISDCTDQTTHNHDGSLYYGHYNDDGHGHSNNAATCSVTGCTQTGSHSHNSNSGHNGNGHGGQHH